MSNTPARIPFARIQANSVGDKNTIVSDANSALATIDQNLQRIERQQGGMFQPRPLKFGMGGSPSPYVVRATDWLILVDATGGAITLTFPDAARLDGLLVTVVKIDSSANAVTLSATINGAVNPTLATQFAGKIVQAGQGVWYSAPRLTAPDIGPGKFPAGNYEFPNDVKVDGNLEVDGTTSLEATTVTTVTALLKGSTFNTVDQLAIVANTTWAPANPRVLLNIQKGGVGSGGVGVDPSGYPALFDETGIQVLVLHGGWLITNLPTSAAGLPAGALWNSGGVVHVA